MQHPDDRPSGVELPPMGAEIGPGGMAVVVIGGLVSSTALTLVLLPNLFRRYGVEKK